MAAVCSMNFSRLIECNLTPFESLDNWVQSIMLFLYNAPELKVPMIKSDDTGKASWSRIYRPVSFMLDSKEEKQKQASNGLTPQQTHAAVLLYEQERSKCNTKMTISEEIDKRIFLLFPRKTRNVTRRRNPNLSFTFSSIHVDSDPQNLLQWPSSSPSYKIEADFKTKTLKNPTSSSTLLVDYNNSESEKMEMTKTLSNPNSEWSPSSCITENARRSRKRRAVKQRSNGKSKKAKVVHFTWKGKETPKWLVQLMETMKGADLKLIFERTLYKTDVNPGESRLSMPSNHLIRSDFLTPVETRIIEEDIDNDNKTGVGAVLVDHMSRKYGVMLKRWEMKKDTGRGSWNYSLTCGWNDVVKANGLQENDYVSVWSFRWRGVLSFALVPSLTTLEQSSSSLALCV
ncbi:hypothetical protein AALP_AA5G193700 [Arabis alpina]|uniref:TF-B3 domain-containing protein n=1 Tax=Arabis alpina TaxID=50452 RepID=A0A087GY39_ARAAL|nr:hypothetical protein AALP_AA5G193700 [Arabis alpina]